MVVGQVEKNYGEADIAVVSDKGQIVIPQTIRQKLGIKRKTKLLVYGYKDAVIMKKMEIPDDVVKDLQALYEKIDAKVAQRGGEELSYRDIERLVASYRKKKEGRPAAATTE